MLPRLLLLTNIETDRGYLGKRRACNNLYIKKKITNHDSMIRKETNRANYNLGHNILELYNVLIQTPLTKSKTKRDI